MGELERQRKERCQVCPIDIAHVARVNQVHRLSWKATFLWGSVQVNVLLTLAAWGLRGKWLSMVNM